MYHDEAEVKITIFDMSGNSSIYMLHIKVLLIHRWSVGWNSYMGVKHGIKVACEDNKVKMYIKLGCQKHFVGETRRG